MATGNEFFQSGQPGVKGSLGSAGQPDPAARIRPSLPGSRADCATLFMNSRTRLLTFRTSFGQISVARMMPSSVGQRLSDLDDARKVIEDWRVDYNEVRPHSSVGRRPPAVYARLLADMSPAEMSPTVETEEIAARFPPFPQRCCREIPPS